MAKPSNNSQDVLVANPKARLFDQVREVMRFHHYALRTEQAYSHRSRTARAQGREHHADLHVCDEETGSVLSPFVPHGERRKSSSFETITANRPTLSAG